MYKEYANAINHLDLNGIYRPYEITAEYTLFPSACGTLTRIPHILKYKISLNNF